MLEQNVGQKLTHVVGTFQSSTYLSFGIFLLKKSSQRTKIQFLKNSSPHVPS